MGLLFWIGASLILLVLLNYLGMRKYRKTARQARESGLEVKMPWTVFGHYPELLINQKPLVETAKYIFNNMRDKEMDYVFANGDAVLIINNPDLIREFTVKSFDHFVDRMNFQSAVEGHPEVAKMLINLTGDNWKTMRAALSPAFTSGKLKALTSTMSKAGPGLWKFIDREMEKKGKIEMKETMGRYTMGVIAHAVYGVDARVYEEEQSQFAKCAKMLQLDLSLKLFIVLFFYNMFPRLAQALGLKLFKKEPFDFFGSVTREIIRQKKSSGEKSADMLQVLLDTKEKGERNQTKSTQMDADSFRDTFEKDAEISNVEQEEIKSALDEEGVIQSAVLFLLAGFDTTASALSLITYHLATKPEVQERAREEVDRAAVELVDEANFEYDDVNKLEYLEMVINETFRVTPISGFLERICTKGYSFSNGVQVEKGMRVQVPLAGLNMSSKYWDDPEKFVPERFNKENKRKINSYVFMPFGSGPRNCIGMRFAMMEIKIALYYLLRNFELHPSESTQVPPTFEKLKPATSIKGGNWLRLMRRNE